MTVFINQLKKKIMKIQRCCGDMQELTLIWLKNFNKVIKQENLSFIMVENGLKKLLKLMEVMDYVINGWLSFFLLKYVSQLLVQIDESNIINLTFYYFYQGDYVAKKQKIQDAFKVKEHADKAHELCPNDGTILHFLGRFAFTIAGISWVKRKIAASFIASPPTATYEEALEYFLKADEKRQFLLNQLWIAKTYLAMKKKPEAKEWFTKVSEGQPECESDKQDIEEAKTALKKL